MFLQYLKIALLMIRAKPVRAALSLLGIYIGVLSLIVILCIQEGIRVSIEQIYSTPGARVVFIYPGFDESHQRAGMLTRDDVAYLASVPGIQRVLPRFTEEKDIRSPAGTLHVHAAGIDPGFGSVYQIPLDRGRFFIPAEVDHRQPVCLLTRHAVKELFPLSNPIGATIDVSGISFEVVGIVRWDGHIGQRTMMEEPDLLLPYTWLGNNQGSGEGQNSWLGINPNQGQNDQARPVEFIPSIEVRVRPDIPPAKADALVLNAIARGNADRTKAYNVYTLEQFFERRQENNARTKNSLLAIAAVSLLVGTIGVANVMLTSVTERTREVGIRKAVGARRRDILFQFLVEASVLSGTGGILAVASGWIITTLYPVFFKKSTPLLFPERDIVACLVLTVLIGVLAGVYPASRAASLSPAEALRYE